MASEALVQAITRQEWMDPVADLLQGAVSGAVEKTGATGQAVADALHGTWLGHPLHPALTDVPVGAWTAAAALDAIAAARNSEAVDQCATGAIAIGLVGALGAAAAGLMDWRHISHQQPRRLGLTHGLLNIGAALLYGTSLIARRRGARGVGRGLAFLGYATAGLSAYLGGHLVFEHHLGVDHATEQKPPQEWTWVMAESDLPVGEPRRVDVGDARILLLRRGDQILAIGEKCTHLGGPLAEGKLEGDSIVCPWHGSRFSLEDGHVINGPAVFPERCIETRVRDGQIEVRAGGRGESCQHHRAQPAPVESEAREMLMTGS
ncbi:MAG TPA: Rieske 2Fe-2S domain-containing protein [Armatimonadota bacterium]|nr:Rieske 2Fe-2S domain-containing protein [Armatimonadota bacterium]